MLFIYKYVGFELRHNTFFANFVGVNRCSIEVWKTQYGGTQNTIWRKAKRNMEKRATLAAMFAFATACIGQQPWRLNLVCPEERIHRKLNLYEENIEVPGLEAFGPMNGYMDGNIYGVWYVVGFDIKDDKHATITIANDLGSEDQKLTLTQNADSTYQLKFLGYNAVKRAQGKKLIKIPSEFKMVNDK